MGWGWECGPASKEALFRFLVISQVRLLLSQAKKRNDAIEEVAGRIHTDLDGHFQRRSARTLSRWLTDFEQDGFAGLEPVVRDKIESSIVIKPELLDFFSAQKGKDRTASIPELIKRARQLGLLKEEERIDRTTVWRALGRMGVDVRRAKAPRTKDTRRFEYPHRMEMVLADGKHFRAGVERAKRVALFFLDDHSRKGLHVVVGTSETAELFLRGVYELVSCFGHFGIIYLDQGPGFISHDTIEVIARLDSLLIHGEAGYPEGHGKIERFNQTAKAQVLRFDRRPDVNPACEALELRLQHYLREVYNHTPHEGIGNETPDQRFTLDPRPLRLPESENELRSRFVVHFERTVSGDHVVPVDGIDYEVPRGLADRKVIIHRRILDGSLAVLHGGELVTLHPVDLAHNARARRARNEPDEQVEHALPQSAADLAFERAYRPLVDEHGGFSERKKDS